MTDRLLNSPEEFRDGVIVTRAIKDFNVTESKLSADSVTRNKIPKGFLVNWITPPATPMTASTTGSAGDACYTSPYLYVCVATNTWIRLAETSW